MTADPHLLPDGSTSWGPDKKEYHAPAFYYEQRVAELEAERDHWKRKEREAWGLFEKAEADRDRLASYTDSDVERVAEALAEYDDLATPERAHRQRARAALDAYLKAPT